MKNVQVILTSFQSCVLFRFGWDASSSTAESPSWLVRRNDSLDTLFRSSSSMLGATELISDPVAVPSPALRRASRSARFFCNSFVNSSTGRASNISSAAVGNNASTVYVQSVWFCSNRRRKLHGQVSRVSLHSLSTRLRETEDNLRTSHGRYDHCSSVLVLLISCLVHIGLRGSPHR